MFLQAVGKVALNMLNGTAVVQSKARGEEHSSRCRHAGQNERERESQMHGVARPIFRPVDFAVSIFKMSHIGSQCWPTWFCNLVCPGPWGRSRAELGMPPNEGRVVKKG